MNFKKVLFISAGLLVIISITVFSRSVMITLDKFEVIKRQNQNNKISKPEQIILFNYSTLTNDTEGFPVFDTV